MKSAVSKVILVLLLLLSGNLSAQSLPTPLQIGIDQFGRGTFNEALRSFRDVILDPSMERVHADAYYWIARCYLAVDDIDNAEKSLEFYLANYTDHSLYAEGYYQKGRLLYLQKEYESSIRVLYDFIERYSSSPFLPNAYYWIGECLFSLGALDDAKKIFSLIPERFPTSTKVEASRYRTSLIDLKEREEVLLNIIQMSHEEYIKVLEDFQMRERTYKQALDIYQRKLADAATADKDGTITRLKNDISSRESEILSLKDNILDLQTQIQTLSRQLEQTRSDLSSAETALRDTPMTEQETAFSASSVPMGTQVEQLLELKARALELQEFYLEWLTAEMEAGL